MRGAVDGEHESGSDNDDEPYIPIIPVLHTYFPGTLVVPGTLGNLEAAKPGGAPKHPEFLYRLRAQTIFFAETMRSK